MSDNKYTRKVIKNGRNSYYINIPLPLKTKLRIKEGQKLVVSKRGKGISIVDWPVRGRGKKK